MNMIRHQLIHLAQAYSKELSSAAGRPVNFMVYDSAETAMARGASIAVPSESAISSAINSSRAAQGAESDPSVGGEDAGAGDMLGVVGWILLFLDAEARGYLQSEWLPGSRARPFHLPCPLFWCAPVWVDLSYQVRWRHGRGRADLPDVVTTAREVGAVCLREAKTAGISDGEGAWGSFSRVGGGGSCCG
jgi:hypothetical protein